MGQFSFVFYKHWVECDHSKRERKMFQRVTTKLHIFWFCFEFGPHSTCVFGDPVLITTEENVDSFLLKGINEDVDSRQQGHQE
jgi:hypothetical protein